jgi:hypothetical protein
MKAQIILATVALAASFLTGVSPAATAAPPLLIPVDGLGETLINEQILEDTIESSGIELVAVTSDGSEVELNLASQLGNGEALESQMTFDFETTTAILHTDAATSNSLDATFSILVEELNGQEIAFAITDVNTGKVQHYSSDEGVQSVLPAIVVGLALGVKALAALQAASRLIVVARITYVLVSEAMKVIQQSGSDRQHFLALRRPGGLFIGNGISFNAAVDTARAGSDVWSRSESGAEAVCRSARHKQPIGPEIDRRGSGLVWHFHPAPRKGAHCFYGPPR